MSTMIPAFAVLSFAVAAAVPLSPACTTAWTRINTTMRTFEGSPKKGPRPPIFFPRPPKRQNVPLVCYTNIVVGCTALAQHTTAHCAHLMHIEHGPASLAVQCGASLPLSLSHIPGPDP